MIRTSVEVCLPISTRIDFEGDMIQVSRCAPFNAHSNDQFVNVNETRSASDHAQTFRRCDNTSSSLAMRSNTISEPFGQKSFAPACIADSLTVSSPLQRTK